MASAVLRSMVWFCAALLGEFVGILIHAHVVSVNTIITTAVLAVLVIAFNELWIWSFYKFGRQNLEASARQLAFGVVAGTLPLMLVVWLRGDGDRLAGVRNLALVIPALAVTVKRAYAAVVRYS